jgi:hypothetical protein
VYFAGVAPPEHTVRLVAVAEVCRLATVQGRTGRGCATTSFSSSYGVIFRLSRRSCRVSDLLALKPAPVPAAHA